MHQRETERERERETHTLDFLSTSYYMHKVAMNEWMNEWIIFLWFFFFLHILFSPKSFSVMHGSSPVSALPIALPCLGDSTLASPAGDGVLTWQMLLSYFQQSTRQSLFREAVDIDYILVRGYWEGAQKGWNQMDATCLHRNSLHRHKHCTGIVRCIVNQ